MAARAAVVEGPDPDRLPEHDLLRERRLRDRAGGRRSTSASTPRRCRCRRRRCSPGSRADPTLYDPVTHPMLAKARRARVLADMLEQQDITQRPVPARARGAAAARRRTCTSPARRARRRTSRTTSSSSSSTSTAPRGRSAAGCRCGRRSTSTCRRSRATRSRSGCPRTPGRRRRSSRSTRATAACWPCIGGRELPREPVQPGRAGRAPARLVVQALRARGGAAAGDLAVDDLRVQAGHDLARHRQDLARPQLRGLEPGHDRPRVGDDPFRQHGLRAAGAGSSGRRRSPTPQRRLGITSHLDPFFSIVLGGEAVNPLEMARAYSPFANGGRRVDGSIFGNRPAGDPVRERPGQQPRAEAGDLRQRRPRS